MNRHDRQYSPYILTGNEEGGIEVLCRICDHEPGLGLNLDYGTTVAQVIERVQRHIAGRHIGWDAKLGSRNITWNRNNYAPPGYKPVECICGTVKYTTSRTHTRCGECKRSIRIVHGMTRYQERYG